jgi:putative endonuclease
MNHALAEQRGRSAERSATCDLRMKNWRIIDACVWTPVGEIDIVARRFRTTAFVEVKTCEKSADLDYAENRHRRGTTWRAGRRCADQRHPGRARAATQTHPRHMARHMARHMGRLE